MLIAYYFISQPTEHQRILLQHLGLRLPTALVRAGTNVVETFCYPH
jgi:hypothetical protein